MEENNQKTEEKIEQSIETALNLQDEQPIIESSDRPLAYIQRILELAPIPGADLIEVATILGWKVVVGKGAYKVGDPVIYCEIDSILPPWQVFIDDKLDKNKFRIKTIRLRGQISQGYCIKPKHLETHPTRSFQLTETVNDETKQVDLSLLDKADGSTIPLIEGKDLTQLIGITKYEVQNSSDFKGPSNRQIIRNFPDFLKKTDQPRIQNFPQYPTLLAEVEFEVTEKLEGQSVTAYFRKSASIPEGRFGICSRNLELKTEGEDISNVVKTLLSFEVDKKMREYGQNVALQGELIGPGIQCNIYKLKEYRWVIFDVFLIDEYRYATSIEREKILNEIGYADRVPVLFPSYKIGGMKLDEIVKMGEGKSTLLKTQEREGIVFKSNSVGNSGSPVTFKAISNAYLLKAG
eukprot:TRINITY_DN10455_c0_g1_i1.p1 TRINITY_DN10455_c0_g1~~TRINITY_DN10455_c0_g1_i1.p1  ORF type:complete len:407 (+),score=129.98 TRINITY_DN10455_c0_g1_i1:134-1354(+)